MKGNPAPDQRAAEFILEEQALDKGLAQEPAGLLAGKAAGAGALGAGVRGLGQRAVSGVLITTAFAVMWDVIGGLASLLTARFLRPEDYAVFGVAVFALGFGGALVAFNIDTRLVQMQEDPGAAYDYGFTIQLGTGILYVFFALVAAPIASRVYGMGILVPVGLALSLNQLIAPFAWPTIYFQRQLRWWTQRLIGSAGPVVQIVLTLVLAIRGFGVWSLVYGSLAANLTSTGLTWWLAPRRPRLSLRIPRDDLRSFFAFGWPLWVAGLVSVAALNGILWEVKITLGLAMLGYLRIAVGL